MAYGIDSRLFHADGQMNTELWLIRARTRAGVGRCDCGGIMVAQLQGNAPWETMKKGTLRHYIAECNTCGWEVVKVERRQPQDLGATA